MVQLTSSEIFFAKIRKIADEEDQDERNAVDRLRRIRDVLDSKEEFNRIRDLLAEQGE